MATRKRIRAQLQSDPELGELARDTQGVLDSQPTIECKTVTEVYNEPMTIGFDREPFEIHCRVRSADTLEAVVASGAVSYTFVGTSKGGVRVDDIAGLSVGIKYRIDYVATFKPEGA